MLLLFLAISGGGQCNRFTFWPVIEIARRDKNERVCCDERKRMVLDFKGFGHLVTSHVK